MVRILIVEDNPGDVVLVREALREAELPFELHHIADGEQAVEYVRKDAHESHSLVVLDLNLPKRDGWEVLHELRSTQNFAKTPVVILSSSSASADVSRAQRFDRLMYIRKPPSLDEYLSIGHKIRGFLVETQAA